MSVSRMKNLIILVLSICAACLLAVAVPNRLSQTHEQRRMLAELKTLYESYGCASSSTSCRAARHSTASSFPRAARRRPRRPCSARRRCSRTAATALKANIPRSSAR